ncbi:TonB-dependent siderophore myxochelin receptor MxcH [Archangium gephyra]|uniref:TonB-dependent siderophore myxochelin receptor MxcH n=1 Tax=Archangium gephyra TaxID=48 RepID=UPI003B7B18AB
MSRPRVLIAVLWLGLLLPVVVGAPAHAGEADVAVEPPAPHELAEAVYPPEALAERRSARVVLRLTVDAAGQVTGAEVAESAGPGFDEAAREAALHSRFTPARRGGTPIAARILYAYEFHPPVLEGALAGQVLLPGAGGAPAVGAEVLLTDEAEHTHRARTDEEGRFRLEGLPAGVYALRVAAPGLGRAELRVAVVAGETTGTSLRLLPGADQKPLQVTVQGESAAERLRRSAQAVRVVETEQARRQTADLGEVLARSEGVGVQRGGGLGSGARFTLNGLSDDQIRFLLDGLPLELSGYPSGIANVPVNLIERVEIYRGVVPIRFGADALGGAVNLVTDEDIRGTLGAVSYQGGAFGTHRLTLHARHLYAPGGFFARVGGFLDRADNDYPIDVEVADAKGRLSPARVHRFHDGYRASGLHAEAGFVDRPWARRLLLRGFLTRSSKELQHNPVMTVPYGEAGYDRDAAGATLRYEQVLASGVSLGLVGGYSYGETRFLDVGTCVYNWFGQCLLQRVQPGELEARPRDQVTWQHGGLARLHLGWRPHPGQELRFSAAPTYVRRTGDERAPTPPGSREPLSAVHELLTLVTGVEHEWELLGGRLENLLFLKDYLQLARSRESLPGGLALAQERRTHRLGLGDALRLRLSDGLQAKASYEWATRLPRADEAFGDGVLVAPNPELQPETSHNLNVGLAAELPGTAAGAFRGELQGFLRLTDQLIVLLGSDNAFAYRNVYAARSVGLEASGGWTLPGDFLSLEGNATWQDFRNTSGEGAFGGFLGDRIPNRPYFFANASARLRREALVSPGDELSLVWNLRYVHAFFRGWESVGLRDSKQGVPSQTQHFLALTYVARGNPVTLGFTAEVQNLMDEKAYDFFGVQRPGRAFYFKTTLSLEGGRGATPDAPAPLGGR